MKNFYHFFNGNCLDIIPFLSKNNIQVDLIATDLPYGVTNRNKWDIIIPFEKLWTCYKQILKPNGAIILTARQPFTTQLIASNMEWFKFTMVWRKNLKTGNLNARKRPMVAFEDIVVFYKIPPTYNPQKIPRTFQQKSGNTKNSKTTNYGKQKQDYVDRQSDSLMPDDVLDGEDGFSYVETLNEIENGCSPILYVECVHNASGKLHPTQKPVALFEWIIKSFSNEGDIVLDNCMGSGTTIEAAFLNKRSAIGIDIESQFYQLSIDRFKSKLLFSDFIENEEILPYPNRNFTIK